MNIEFYNKATGEKLSDEYDYIIRDGELWALQFASANSTNPTHIYNGEGWKQNIDFECKIIN